MYDVYRYMYLPAELRVYAEFSVAVDLGSSLLSRDSLYMYSTLVVHMCMYAGIVIHVHVCTTSSTSSSRSTRRPTCVATRTCSYVYSSTM